MIDHYRPRFLYPVLGTPLPKSYSSFCPKRVTRNTSGNGQEGDRLRCLGWGLYAVGVGLTAACAVLYLALRGLVLVIDD